MLKNVFGSRYYKTKQEARQEIERNFLTLEFCTHLKLNSFIFFIINPIVFLFPYKIHKDSGKERDRREIGEE